MKIISLLGWARSVVPFRLPDHLDYSPYRESVYQKEQSVFGLVASNPVFRLSLKTSPELIPGFSVVVGEFLLD
jgi:hypothetical protein